MVGTKSILISFNLKSLPVHSEFIHEILFSKFSVKPSDK